MYHKENGERIAFLWKLWYARDRKGRKGDFYEHVRYISDVRYTLCMCNYSGDASDLCCNLLSGMAACPKEKWWKGMILPIVFLLLGRGGRFLGIILLVISGLQRNKLQKEQNKMEE